MAHKLLRKNSNNKKEVKSLYWLLKKDDSLLNYHLSSKAVTMFAYLANKTQWGMVDTVASFKILNNMTTCTLLEAENKI